MNTCCAGIYFKRLQETLCGGKVSQECGIDVISVDLQYIIESFGSIRVTDTNRVTRSQEFDIYTVNCILSWYDYYNKSSHRQCLLCGNQL